MMRCNSFQINQINQIPSTQSNLANSISCVTWFIFSMQLEQKQVTPPYKPRLDSDRDLANFPPEFTDEPVHLTPDDP